MTAIITDQQLGRENPWPGLESFGENATHFFYGRDNEAQSLFEHVLDAPVTVLYGRSGLGKTSLLKAGLFPLLRKRHFLPIFVRLDLKPEAQSFNSQLQHSVDEAVRAEAPDAPRPLAGESLWEYLHRADLELWSIDNYPLTPVLVLDQFEEVFTLGERVPKQVRALRNDLGDLCENRVPPELAARIVEDETLAERFQLRAQNYKVLISLREDFLPHLETWRRLIPTLGSSRLRLLGLGPTEALEAVHKPAGDLMSVELARNIVEFIAGMDMPRDRGAARVGGELAEDESTELEPALLSLFCRELNEERKSRELACFDQELVDEAKGDVLPNYYSSCVDDLRPQVAEFIESELISETGFRNSFPREDAVPARLTKAELTRLINDRLLRFEERYGAQRIELTHDVLTGVVREHRDRRRAEDAARQSAAELEDERDRRHRSERTGQRFKRLSVALMVVCVLAVLAAASALWYAHSASVAREEAATRSREALALRLTSQAEATLAGRRSGGDVRAFEQLLAAHKVAPEATGDGALLDAVIARRNLLRIIDTTDQAWSVAVSPDGSRFVSGSPDGSLRLWRLDTGEQVATLGGHKAAVAGVAFSADGRRIVSGSFDNTIRLWDANTGQSVGEPISASNDEAINCVAMSPDGHRIAAGTSSTSSSRHAIRLWDADTGQPIGQPLTGHTDTVTSVAFSPDGRTIASGSVDESIRIWDARTGQPIGQPLTGHTDTVTSVAFSPDGRTIASGSADESIRIWDARTGQPIGQPLAGHTNAVTSVAFSPDGGQIISGSADRTIRLWDAQTHEAVGQPFTGHADAVDAVAVSPDGRHLVSGSRDNTLRVWDTAAGHPMVGHTDWVNIVKVSPDGHRVVSGSDDDTIRVWNLDTGQPIGKPLDCGCKSVVTVAFSPDGHRLASGGEDGTIRLWNSDTEQPIGTPLGSGGASVLTVAFSPDGHRLASGSEDGTIRLWNPDSATAPVTLTGHTFRVWSVAFSPDGKRLVSGGEDGTVRLWDLDKAAPIGEPWIGHTDIVTSVAFSPDGTKVASAAGDGTVRLWDPASGTTVGDPWTGHTDTVWSLAFSPDGQWIVTGSGDDTLRLWDAATGEPIGSPIGGHRDAVFSVAVSPNGQWIVSGGADHTVRTWPAPVSTLSDQLCAKLTQNMNPRQWKKWISDDPDIPYQQICAGLQEAQDDGPH